MPTSIKLIVGLGNPGAQYANTRHNVGAWFVAKLAEQYTASLCIEAKFFSQITKVLIDSNPVWLSIPTTYMNESGKAVAAVASYYKISVEEILVVHDELDFNAGTIRLKEHGGHGGHNGLRDIINHLHSKNFYRMRIGIGHPGHKDRVTPYVLSVPSRADKARIMQSIDEGLSVISDLSAGRIQQAFHYLHSD